MSSFDKILVLAPHTDDGEFGCGGAIAKWLEEGKEIYYVAFSSAEKSVPEGFPKGVLRKEVKEATKELGILPQNVILFDYPVRDFPLHRQEILEDMVKLDKKLSPDLVLVPSTDDRHQDHQVICQEGFRAFKKRSIIGYEMIGNNLKLTTNLFVVLTKNQVLKKCDSLEKYKSQVGRGINRSTMISLATVRGNQIGEKFAEVFEVIRMIL